MNEQKVSVVMPNYNGEKHIKQAIDSVLGQTYENLELIIVDDNSSDGSKNIIEAYDDKRLKKVYSSFNRHVSYTVNLGFAEADGEFIARIDSDDIWEPYKIQKQVDFMRKNPEYGACFTKVKIIDEEGKEADAKFPDISRMFNEADNKPRKEWIYQFLRNGNCLCNPSVLMNKKAACQIGLYYNIAYVPAEDFDMWLRMVFKNPIYLMEETLTRYRWTESEEKISSNGQKHLNSVLNVYAMINMSILEKIENEDFCRLFKSEFVYPKSETELEIECEKAYLLSRCNENNFAALTYFERILNTEVGLDTLESKFGFSLKDHYMSYRKRNFYDTNAEDEKKILEETILQLEDQKKKNQKYVKQICDMKQKLKEIKRSKSWKVTKPFRKIRSLF